MVFATNNAHKLEEIREILGEKFHIVSLKELGCQKDIPEEQDTLEGNALQKARYIRDKYKVNCFADDTGLEIEALGGEPGVYSARYAGDGHDSEANMRKVLDKMSGETNRRARFRTVIALLLDGQEHLFEGEVRGEILRERHGEGGFGYDPIFRPEGFTQSFAEMSLEDKNKISHRGRATEALRKFLNEQ